MHPSLAKMHALSEPPHMTFPALELLAAGPSLTLTASISPSLPGAAPYTSVLDCVKTTLRTSGARGPFQVGWVGTGMAQLQLVAAVRGTWVAVPPVAVPPSFETSSHNATQWWCRACPPRCCAMRPPTRFTSARLRWVVEWVGC